MSTRDKVSAERIIHGIKWTYIGTILRVLAQLGIAAVLARLLTPTEFGLVALGMVVIRFAKYFSDMGMVGAIIQQQRMEREDIGAAFAVTAMLGTLFFGAVFLLGDMIAGFYDKPELGGILQLLALGFILSGLATTSQGLLRRELRFKYLSLAETLSYVLGYGVIGIGLALTGFGIYALVGAFLTQSTILLVLVYARCRHPLGIPLNAEPYRSLLGFGGRYSLLNFLGFLTSNLDHLVIGKFYPAAVLGFYDRAKYLVFLPTYHLLTSLTQVLLPSYASLQNDLERLRSLYLRGVLLMGFVLLPLSAGIVAAAEQLVAVLLGAQWEETSNLVRVFALYIPIDLLTSVGATLCSATGQLKMQLRIQSFSLLLLAAGFLVFIGDPVMYIAAWVGFVYWVRFILYTWLVRRTLNTGWREHLTLHAGQFAAALWVFACIHVVTIVAGSLHVGLLLPLQIATGGISLGVFILFGPFSAAREAMGELLETMGANKSRHPSMLWLVRQFAR